MVAQKIKGFLILACILLSSCSTTKYVDRTVEVNVPVYVIPEIKPLEKPKLPVKSLNENSSYSDIVEAYYNSLKMEIEYGKKLEKLLSPFFEAYTNGHK